MFRFRWRKELTGSFAITFVTQVVTCCGTSWEGVVLHERPDLYEADNVTLRPNSGKIPLRLITNRPESGAVGDAMGRLVPILRQAVGEINNSTSVLPDYVLELYLTDSLCANHKAAQSTVRIIYANPPGFFHAEFGPLCSGPTGAVNDIIQVFNMFQLATISRGAFLSDGARYPYLCRTSPSLQFVADGISKFAQIMGWTKVGAVQDTKALSASTVTEFKAAVREAAAQGYAFDESYLSLNSYVIDNVNFNSADIVGYLRNRVVKVVVVALYEDVGAPFYCELYRQGYYGKQLQTILALSWWGDSWIAEQVAEQASSIPCSVQEIWTAARGMFSMGQTAFLVSTQPHAITGTVLNNIKENYYQGCSAPNAEGCHFDFASYDYDGLTLMAKAFHTWIYDQGHNLTEIDYMNANPQRELYEIVKYTSFLGCTGQVEFFNETSLDCERKGTFSVRQLNSLALSGGDQGWHSITSFTNTGGFAELTPWTDIIWQDGTVTYMGGGSGWRTVARGQPASFGTTAAQARGLDLVPIDWVSCEHLDGFTSNGVECVPCPTGMAGERGECFDCIPGKITADLGQSFCTPCPDGMYQGLAGQSSCLNCTAGNVSQEADRSSCTPCPIGRFQSEERQAECLWCPTGRFQNLTGQTDCDMCPPRRTTSILGAFQQSFCVCAEAYYEPYPMNPGDRFACDSCPDKMKCAEGSRLENLLMGRDLPKPLVERGYMTLEEDPLEVFMCLQTSACPGGVTAQCAQNRDVTSIACGICEVGSYDDGEGCVACGAGAGALPLTFAIIIGVVGLGILTFVINRDFLMQSHGSLACVISAGNLFAGIQTLSIFSALSIEWYEPLKSLLKIMSLISFDLKILKMGCVVGGNPLLNYAGRLFVAPIGALVILIILVIKKKFIRKDISVSVEFSNTVGTIFNLFFISICISAFVPMVCYLHPGGESSMRASPSVLCFKGAAHRSMVALGLVGFLLVPLPFAAFATLATIKYPQITNTAGDRSAKFLAATRFFFFRFHPEKYHYGLFLLGRSLTVCLVPVVVRDDTPLQVMVMAIVISLFMLSMIGYTPYRLPMNNFFDGAINLAMLLMLVVGTMAIGLNADPTSITLVATLVMVIVILLAVTMFGVAIYKLVRKKPYYGKFICHHKAHAAGQARLLKVLLQAKTSQSVFIDSDDLTELDSLFDLVKTKVHTLVVYLTRSTLTRPWCAGEIATAMACGVCKVVVVRTASFVPPTTAQCQRLEDYLDLKSCKLEAYGITLEHVSKAYIDIMNRVNCETIEVPTLYLGAERYDKLVERILNPGYGNADDAAKLARSGGVEFTALPNKTDVLAISSEPFNEEATAASIIIVNSIRHHLLDKVKNGIIQLCDYENGDTDAIVDLCLASRCVVVLLSAGTLSNSTQLGVMMNTTRRYIEKGAPAVIPVSLPGFTFPNDDYYDRMLPPLMGKEEPDTAEKIEAVRSFFKTISASLSTHASEDVIEAECKEIERRIPKQLSAASVKTMASSTSAKEDAEGKWTATGSTDGSKVPRLSGLEKTPLKIENSMDDETDEDRVELLVF